MPKRVALSRERQTQKSLGAWMCSPADIMAMNIFEILGCDNLLSMVGHVWCQSQLILLLHCHCPSLPLVSALQECFLWGIRSQRTNDHAILCMSRCCNIWDWWPTWSVLETGPTTCAVKSSDWAWTFVFLEWDDVALPLIELNFWDFCLPLPPWAISYGPL
jgi:hypothetical protein